MASEMVVEITDVAGAEETINKHEFAVLSFYKNDAESKSVD